MTDFQRCWACDMLLRESRVEMHHVLGKTHDKLVPLCVPCHDLIDRVRFNEINVFAEFMKAATELEDLPRGKTKYMRLFLLKNVKMIAQIQDHQKNLN